MTEASPCHIVDPVLMTDSRDFFIRHGFTHVELSFFLLWNNIETIQQLSTLSPEDVTLLATKMNLNVEKKHDFRFLIWWVTSEVQKAKKEQKTFKWTPEIEARENDARTKYDDHLMTDPNEFFQHYHFKHYQLTRFLTERNIKTIEQLSTISSKSVTKLVKEMQLKLKARQDFRFLIWWVTSEVQKAKKELKTFKWTPAMDAQENDARIEYEKLRLQKFDQIIESKTPMMIQNPYLVQLAL